MIENSVHGVVSFFALICLIGLFLTAWQSLVVDAVRQRMFEVRDRAFLWAHDNGHLQDPAYRQFREAANLAIRYHENLSLVKLLVIGKIFHLGKNSSRPQELFMQNDHLKSEFHKLTEVVVRGVVLRSFFIMVPLILVSPILAFLAALAYLLNSGNLAVLKRLKSTLSREVEAELLLSQAK